MLSAGFKFAIPTTERLQTYVLDRAATATESLYKHSRVSIIVSLLTVNDFKELNFSWKKI